MTRPWIKSYTTMLDDVRLLRLNDRQQLRYFQLYLLAGRLNADGLFVENNEKLNENDIAIKLRINDRKQFTADFKALKAAGLIKANGHGPYIEAFAREQVDWSRKQEQERERKAKQRHENVTRDTSVTDKKSRNGHTPVTPLDQTKTKKKIKKKKEIKNQPPQPPSKQRTRKAAPVVGGGNDGKSSQPSLSASTLSPQAEQIAPVVVPMLRSSGLSSKKIETILNILATRIEPANVKRYTLAALASAYSDKDAKNPPIVAAYRIEHDSVPAIFENSNTWQVIPAAVLKAADVDMTRISRENPLRKVAENVSNIR